MKKNQIILIIVGVLILIGLISYFIYLQKIIKSGTGPLSEEVPDLCTKFSEIKDTVACEAARTIVLEKYPGEIKYIRRTNAEIIMGIIPNEKKETKEVWLFGISLNSPIKLGEEELNNAKILVARDSGELRISVLTNGEL